MDTSPKIVRGNILLIPAADALGTDLAATDLRAGGIVPQMEIARRRVTEAGIQGEVARQTILPGNTFELSDIYPDSTQWY